MCSRVGWEAVGALQRKRGARLLHAVFSGGPTDLPLWCLTDAHSGGFSSLPFLCKASRMGHTHPFLQCHPLLLLLTAFWPPSSLCEKGHREGKWGNRWEPELRHLESHWSGRDTGLPLSPGMCRTSFKGGFRHPRCVGPRVLQCLYLCHLQKKSCPRLKCGILDNLVEGSRILDFLRLLVWFPLKELPADLYTFSSTGKSQGSPTCVWSTFEWVYMCGQPILLK